MIPRLSWVAVSCIVCSCSVEESPDPQPRIGGHITIMPESTLPRAIELFGRQGCTYWQPSAQEVEKAANLIHAALVRGRKNPFSISERAYNPRDDWISEYYTRKIGDVLNQYSLYSCQVIGLQDRGKKFIAFSFFPMKVDRPWRNVDSMFVEVFDGGADYWRIEYDVLERRFVSFEPNGDG